MPSCDLLCICDVPQGPTVISFIIYNKNRVARASLSPHGDPDLEEVLSLGVDRARGNKSVTSIFTRFWGGFESNFPCVIPSFVSRCPEDLVIFSNSDPGCEGISVFVIISVGAHITILMPHGYCSQRGREALWTGSLTTLQIASALFGVGLEAR